MQNRMTSSKMLAALLSMLLVLQAAATAADIVLREASEAQHVSGSLGHGAFCSSLWSEVLHTCIVADPCAVYLLCNGSSFQAQSSLTLLRCCHCYPAYLQRQLRMFDQLFPGDVCINGTETFGPCDTSLFPVCDPDTELICYNRRPMRSQFWSDIRQPKYYIDYVNVYCYPNYWEGCSSCSPGRLCRAESRCILQDDDYPCAKWI
jgi:hypothetical protein